MSPSTIVYPKQGTTKKFSKKHALYPMSFCCFLDLESLNKKTEIHEDESILAKQQAFLGKFQIVNLREKRTVCERKFVGLDCIDKLLTDLQETWENTIKNEKKYKIDWTPEKKKLHEQARQRKSCNVKFDNSDAKKVKHAHHLHYKEKDRALFVQIVIGHFKKELQL